MIRVNFLRPHLVPVDVLCASRRRPLPEKVAALYDQLLLNADFGLVPGFDVHCPDGSPDYGAMRRQYGLPLYRAEDVGRLLWTIRARTELTPDEYRLLSTMMECLPSGPPTHHWLEQYFPQHTRGDA